MSEEKLFSPWVHPVGRAEIMALRTALYGLRQYEAIALLGDVTAPCATCERTGLLGAYGAIGWHVCPTATASVSPTRSAMGNSKHGAGRRWSPTLMRECRTGSRTWDS